MRGEAVHACVDHLFPSLCGHMETGKSCTHGALPAVMPARRGLPHRTLLPRQTHTHTHDCVHTSPCILRCAQTWHPCILQQVVAWAPSRALHPKLGSKAPSRPNIHVPARPRHLHCPSPRRRRRGPAASAPPQGARARRLCASWCPRTGEQGCGQRRGHSDKAVSAGRDALLAGHPSLRTRTSACIMQQVVAWEPSSAMHPKYAPSTGV